MTDSLTGKTVKYDVVGVLKQINASIYEGGPNSAVIITKSGLKEISNQDTYSRIIVRVSDISNEDNVDSSIKEYMSQVHRNKAYLVISASMLYAGTQIIYNIVKYVLGGIGAISLLVGDIGIMNVMMLTIRERVKEIGLMKAVGANSTDVQMIFLMEAVLLGLFSSVTGVAIAAIASGIVGYIGKFPVGVSMQNAFIGIAFGLTWTLAFGVYPASQASKLDPIEALRTE